MLIFNISAAYDGQTFSTVIQADNKDDAFNKILPNLVEEFRLDKNLHHKDWDYVAGEIDGLSIEEDETLEATFDLLNQLKMEREILSPKSRSALDKTIKIFEKMFPTFKELKLQI